MTTRSGVLELAKNRDVASLKKSAVNKKGTTSTTIHSGPLTLGRLNTKGTNFNRNKVKIVHNTLQINAPLTIIRVTCLKERPIGPLVKWITKLSRCLLLSTTVTITTNARKTTMIRIEGTRQALQFLAGPQRVALIILIVRVEVSPAAVLPGRNINTLGWQLLPSVNTEVVEVLRTVRQQRKVSAALHTTKIDLLLWVI